MDGLATIIMGVLGGGGMTALVGYLGMRYRASGSVRTTEAGDLWREAAAVRKQQSEDIGRLSARIDRLQVELDKERESNRLKDIEIATLKAENHTLKLQIEELQNEIDELRAQALSDIRPIA